MTPRRAGGRRATHELVRENVGLDQGLSAITRRMGAVKGAWRLIEPVRRFYCRRYRGRPDAWTVLRSFDGDLRFRVDRSSYMGSMIYWQGYNSGFELALLDRLLRPDMVFADVGANQGEYTVFAAKRLPRGRVLAFEPLPAYHAQLLDNVNANGFTNVTAHNCGLADADGELELFTSQETDLYDSFNEGLSSIYRSDYRSSVAGVARIRVFDEVFAESGLQRLDVMKVDVEGAELPVLRGARETLARFRPTLLLEVNEEAFRTGGYTSAELLAFVRELGYRPELIRRGGRTEPVREGELPAFANIACFA